jgi:hypothetical protein
MLVKIKHFFQKYESAPVLLALLVLVSYGLTLPFIGFFMDDWYLIWFKHIFGALQFPQYFAVDRPFMGYFYIAASALLGGSESPLVWQIFALFTRWLAAWSILGFLNTLWPDTKKRNVLVAALAAVFPGFTQQWIAAIYSFFFACLAGWVFSLTLMLKAIRQPKHFWLYTALSLVLGVYCYAASEFYFGLELIRPVVLWIEFSRSKRTFLARLKTAFVKWLPYLAAYIGFGVWRGFFYTSAHHEVTLSEQLSQSPLAFVLDAVRKTVQAVVDGAFTSWLNPLNLSNYPEKGKVPLLILAEILFVFVGFLFWFLHINKIEAEKQLAGENQWQREAFWLALISLVVAVLPFLAANLPVSTVYPFDRFLLAYLFGSCLLAVVLVDKKKIGMFFLVILIAVSSGYQVTQSIYYKNMYQQQSDFFWQLSWRAPQIQKNTIVLTEELPFAEVFSSDSLTAPLNMIYNPAQDNQNTAYALLQTYQLPDTIKNYAPDQPVSYSVRNFTFSGNTSQMIVVKKPADGCLRVLMPADYVDPTLKEKSLVFWQAATPLSNLDQIITDTNQPAELPKKYFGTENTDQWCYYFEKADLSRQQGQWQNVIDLYTQADQKHFKPLNVYEWIPLIQAYTFSGNIEKAEEISNNLPITDEVTQGVLCNTWKNIIDNNSLSIEKATITEELSSLNCKIQ